MIKTKVVKSVDTEQKLKQLLKQLQNPTPALEEIGKHLVASTQKRIKDTKESPQGAPWAPWALSTMLGRVKKGTAARGLLQAPGRLYNSVNYTIGQARSTGGQFSTGKAVSVGSQGVPYATFLQNGTRHMPARPFIGISTSDQDAIGSILRRHVFTKR